jgi:hypothetical protein
MKNVVIVTIERVRRVVLRRVRVTLRPVSDKNAQPKGSDKTKGESS